MIEPIQNSQTGGIIAIQYVSRSTNVISLLLTLSSHYQGQSQDRHIEHRS